VEIEERRPGERITFTTRALANEEVPRKVRYSQIIEILKNSPFPLTAKEIAMEMFRKGLVPSDERNWCAPRLTELSYKGIVEPVDKVYCKYSGKLVSRYKLRNEVRK
jgi:hypothetical protein